MGDAPPRVLMPLVVKGSCGPYCRFSRLSEGIRQGFINSPLDIFLIFSKVLVKVEGQG